MMRSLLWLFSAVVIIGFSFDSAFAQHHGGEQAPPISFGDKRVTVEATLSPSDFVPGKDAWAALKIRFFDSITDTNIERVTYRVQIFDGEKLLANHMFYDKDGELDLRVRPVSGCQQDDLWRCTIYEGEKDLIVPNALTSSGNDPPIIRGPVFDKSGTYTLKVAIIGATNPRTQTAEDINFETHIVIPHEQQFSLGTTPITVRSYQDKITSLKFDEAAKSISFEMPFHWEHAEHVDLVRSNLEIPKAFAQYANVHSFKGTINGVPIFPSSIHYDIYSEKDIGTIHFAVGSEELKMIKSKAGSGGHTMKVVISPDDPGSTKSTDVVFSNGYKATVTYDTRYGASKDVAFTMAFFDADGNLAKDVRYAYSIKDVKSENDLVQNIGRNPNLLGIAVPSGVDSRLIAIPNEGQYAMQLILVGRGLVDFGQFASATVAFDVKTKQQPAPVATAQIPPWVKNNAKWWADGTIGDSDFVSGIQFLISQGILKIPPTAPAGQGADQIPPWVKNNAKWWADGTIGDSDFVSGIQFLVSQGIIRV